MFVLSHALSIFLQLPWAQRNGSVHLHQGFLPSGFWLSSVYAEHQQRLGVESVSELGVIKPFSSQADIEHDIYLAYLSKYIATRSWSDWPKPSLVPEHWGDYLGTPVTYQWHMGATGKHFLSTPSIVCIHKMCSVNFPWIFTHFWLVVKTHHLLYNSYLIIIELSPALYYST